MWALSKIYEMTGETRIIIKQYFMTNKNFKLTFMYESVKILFQLIQKMIEQASEKIDMKLITKRCQAGETCQM